MHTKKNKAKIWFKSGLGKAAFLHTDYSMHPCINRWGLRRGFVAAWCSQGNMSTVECNPGVTKSLSGAANVPLAVGDVKITVKHYRRVCAFVSGGR